MKSKVVMRADWKSKMVSIIIPVYNAENTLDRCINSIRGQTFKEWEMILINDGSKDASADICERYALIDMRIRVLNQKNYT